MGLPLAPLPIAPVAAAPTKRWLDDDIVRWAAHDGVPDSLSVDDLQAWYRAERRAFRPFEGMQTRQQVLMYGALRGYLAARLMERGPVEGGNLSRDLLLTGATELIDFATLVRIPDSRGGYGGAAAAFARAVENGLFQWIVGTQDVTALIAVLGTKQGNRAHELAAVRLRELAGPATATRLIAALHDATALVRHQLIQILGDLQVAEAYTALDHLRTADGVGEIVRRAAETALLQIAAAHPARIVDQLIGAVTAAGDVAAATRAAARGAWGLDRWCVPAADGNAATRTKWAALWTQRLAFAIAQHPQRGANDPRPVLIALLGRIPAVPALQRLHDYLDDPHMVPWYELILHAIAEQYRRWDTTGMAPMIREVLQWRTRETVARMLLTTYGVGTTTHRAVSRQVAVAGAPVPVTARVIGPAHYDIATRTALVHALGQFGTTESVDLLRLIVQKEPVPAVRDAALQLLRDLHAGWNGPPGGPPAPRMPHGFLLVPDPPELHTAMPLVACLGEYIDALYLGIERTTIHLAGYDLLVFFEAPAALYDEDRPRDLNAAVRDTVQRALRQFGEAHGEAVAAQGRPHAVHVMTVLADRPDWRVRFLLAPRRATAVGPKTPPLEARLRRWYEAHRPYWRTP